MKTVFLLRHAKSAWDDPALADRDRPLAPRGRRAAKLMGKHLRERGVAPDLILCSTARRATDTLAALLDRWEQRPPVREEDGLYLAGASALLGRLRVLPAEVGSVMLVGHNPDLHDLARELVGAGSAELRRALALKLPTGAFVHIAVGVGRWQDLAPGRGALVAFTAPRDLE